MACCPPVIEFLMGNSGDQDPGNGPIRPFKYTEWPFDINQSAILAFINSSTSQPENLIFIFFSVVFMPGATRNIPSQF